MDTKMYFGNLWQRLGAMFLDTACPGIFILSFRFFAPSDQFNVINYLATGYSQLFEPDLIICSCTRHKVTSFVNHDDKMEKVYSRRKGTMLPGPWGSFESLKVKLKL